MWCNYRFQGHNSHNYLYNIFIYASPQSIVKLIITFPSLSNSLIFLKFSVKLSLSEVQNCSNIVLETLRKIMMIIKKNNDNNDNSVLNIKITISFSRLALVEWNYWRTSVSRNDNTLVADYKSSEYGWRKIIWWPILLKMKKRTQNTPMGTDLLTFVR